MGVAVELDKNNRPRPIAMQGLKPVDVRSLTGFATRHVGKARFAHRVVIAGGGEKAVQVFPWVHAFIDNMKRMILGTCRSVSPKHLDRYLAAFTYRANQRWIEAKLFDRLVIAAIHAKPLTFKELTTGVK